MFKPKISKDLYEEIKKLYVEEKNSLAEIAKKFGVSFMTIKVILNSLGVSTAYRGSKTSFSYLLEKEIKENIIPFLNEKIKKLSTIKEPSGIKQYKKAIIKQLKNMNAYPLDKLCKRFNISITTFRKRPYYQELKNLIKSFRKQGGQH